jgi:3-dehydroquinate dehydratase-2
VTTRIAVLNGPNLNLLGRREPEVYGRTTLAEIEAMVRAEAGQLAVDVEWHQSNHEGVLVDLVQGLPGLADGIIVNAGAFTHTSMALRDAFLAVQVPYVEVHLSNLFAREPARQHSLLAQHAAGFLCGFGAAGYRLALQALVGRLRAG